MKPAGISLADPAFWAQPEAPRGDAFAGLRRDAPVYWQDEPATTIAPAGRGYWALTRHADIVAVSKDHETFTSAFGTEIQDLTLEATRAYGGMLNMGGN